MSDTDGDRSLTDVVSAAEDRLESIAETMEDSEAVSALSGEQREGVETDLEALTDALEETVELLETVDFEAVLDAVDTQSVLKAVNTGEIPDAIQSGDASELVDVQAAVRAINLTNLFDIGNLFSIKEAGEDLEDAVSEVVSDDGVIGETISETTSGDQEDGLLEEVASEGAQLLEEGKEAASEELGEFDLEPGDGETGFDAEQMEAYQQFIQQQAMVGIDEFRAAILETHAKFNALYEYNREHLGRTNKQTTSRNPTAVSTLALERPDIPSVSNHSTVPTNVRYSTAPSRRRIYRGRFKQELEAKRTDEEADTQ